mmetsp:Transcript_30001/g.75495  ORF Transcript_30001/g.75495 Transcript_30001/m.75495 type:complete len:370 (-) Transcript_30001:31-1140(-)
MIQGARAHVAHVADAEVLGLDVLVQTTGDDGTVGLHTAQELGRIHTVRVVGSRERVGRQTVVCHQFDTECCECSLESLAHGQMFLETLLNTTVGKDRLQRDVHCLNQLYSRGGKVAGTLLLIGLHDGDPSRPLAVVAWHRSLAVLGGLQSTGTSHRHTESRRNRESLLTASHGKVNIPLGHAEFLAGDGANTIDSDQDLGTHLTDCLGQSLHRSQHTSAGVHMSNSHNLVGLLAESLLHSLYRRTASNLSTNMIDNTAKVFEHITKRIAKIAGVHNQSSLTSFHGVCDNQIPAERSTGSQHKRLSVRCQKNLTSSLQYTRVARDKVGRHMARSDGGHGLEYVIFVLDWARDHEQGTLLFGSHCDILSET